ncbi:neurturin-like [Cololabis saira]|uniref:neurturin-like n=1 Tax=Cololabis saira TaxID=129043 RepID=UPI002AD34CA5|nr:neurturin-like [Cololabis saira]XP_061586993.1 neurturin-like [Cololabis saira]
MKLWKGATFALVLCGAALSIILVRSMATIGQFKLKTKHPHPSSPSSRPSSSLLPASRTSSSPDSRAPSQHVGAPHRRIRSTGDNMNSLLSEFSMMFQSFTEGELQHVVGSMLDKKRKRNQPLSGSQASRTKRAQRSKPCSLRKLVLTVKELGLGYDSEETVLLHYCSGKCGAHRQNYDITMEHVQTNLKGKGYKVGKVSKGPCCRPTAFEEGFSFLDNKSRYHTIQNVSAKNCGCV